MSQKQSRSHIIIGLFVGLIIILSIVLFIRSNKQQATNITPALLSSGIPIKSDISLVIVGQQKTTSYNISASEVKTVVDALRVAEKQGLQLQTKDYGAELGIFIEAIDGQKNDTANNLYWTLYLNDKQSPTGASATFVNPGDKITWKFEKSSF